MILASGLHDFNVMLGKEQPTMLVGRTRYEFDLSEQRGKSQCISYYSYFYKRSSDSDKIDYTWEKEY